ncbi:MAG: hypothetical protein MK180_06060 [Rhodobacteraceae bacterium]|nr:hypothetical protein [Paracoccaceae bacterium]
MNSHFTKVTNVGSALDEDTRSIYVLFQVAGQGASTGQPFDVPMILDIELTNGKNPSAKRIMVRIDGTRLDA